MVTTTTVTYAGPLGPCKKQANLWTMENVSIALQKTTTQEHTSGLCLSTGVGSWPWRMFPFPEQPLVYSPPSHLCQGTWHVGLGSGQCDKH